MKRKRKCYAMTGRKEKGGYLSEITTFLSINGILRCIVTSQKFNTNLPPVGKRYSPDIVIATADCRQLITLNEQDYRACQFGVELLIG